MTNTPTDEDRARAHKLVVDAVADGKYINEIVPRIFQALADVRADGREAGQREVENSLIDVLTHLVAAVSLLEGGGRKAAPSGKMFAQMLVDYNACIDRARALIQGAAQ